MGRRGQVGTSMTTFRVPPCRGHDKHLWSKWQKAGILDSTIRRECRRCGRIQTKKPPSQ